MTHHPLPLARSQDLEAVLRAPDPDQHYGVPVDVLHLADGEPDLAEALARQARRSRFLG